MTDQQATETGSTMSVELEARRYPQGVLPWAGRLCMWAGLLGAVSGIYLAFVTPAVGPEQFSYPLDGSQFALIQTWFVVQHVGLILGLLGLWVTGTAGPSRFARLGHIAAVAGITLLTLTELAAILAADTSAPSTLITLLEVGYGISSALVGVGLVTVGISVLRHKNWSGWRRFLPLALGVYVFVPMTPALSGPFVAARLAITGWMLLFALLGWVLYHSEGRP